MRTNSAQHINHLNNLYECERGRPLRKEAGFTFVEVMIAVSILAIVITALVGLMNMSSAMAVRAENKARLTDAIAQLADKLRAMPYDDAGKVTTYVSTEGDIVMNLTVTTSKTGTATVKTIIIDGYSTRVDPNNTETATVLLRSSTYENDEEVAFADPPIISSFSIVPAGKTQPIAEGKAAWGTVNIIVSAKTGSAEASLAAFRVYVDAEVVGEILAPNNNGAYTIAWNSTKLNDSNTPLFIDGPKRVSFEAVDNLGGLTRVEQYIRLDNVPVTNTFPAQNIATTLGSTVTVIWSPIPDPDGSPNGAARYYVLLRQTDKKNKVTEQTLTINAASASTDAPTTAKFTVSYDKKDVYEVYVYPMCPDGCNHASPYPYPTKYLYKKF